MESKIKVNPDSPLNSTVFDGRPAASASGVRSGPIEKTPLKNVNRKKSIELLRKHIKKQIDKKRKVNTDKHTQDVLELVRNLSNQDDSIEGQPELSLILKKLVRFSEERRETHSASQQHFDRLNSWFFWPSLIFTSFTSAFSFLATQFPEHSSKFNVTIGIIASISSLIVALSETYRYGSKAEQHGLAAESFENLRTKLFFKSAQLQLNDNKDLSPCDSQAFFKSIEDQITEISRQCKDLVPTKIVKDYKNTRYSNMIESIGRDVRTILVQDKFTKLVEKISQGETVTKKDLKEIELLEHEKILFK